MRPYWDEAPDGAEFYSTWSELFYRQGPEHFEKFSQARQQWEEAAGRFEQYSTLIARPSEPEGAA